MKTILNSKLIIPVDHHNNHSNTTTSHNNPHHHSKPQSHSQHHDDLLKPSKGSTRTRDILANITNHHHHHSAENHVTKPAAAASKKRTSSVFENDGSSAAAGTGSHRQSKSSKLKNVKNSKRKTDPMDILLEKEDEEEEEKVLKVLSIVPIEDIDKNDFHDPQAVSEYVNGIYQYLMEKEKDAVDPLYINKLSDINSNMRSVLIDWLVEVHRMFKLIPETLFMAVSLIDRFLSLSSSVSRDTLQVLGTTALFIASKYEEIYAPECMDFVYVCDGACTKQQILKMEQTVLNTLKFNLTHPTALHFLRRFSKASGSDYLLHTLCKYLIEISLLDINLLKYTPSLIAASAVYLGRAMVGKGPYWTPTLEHYSTYKESKVRECACMFNAYLKKNQKSTSLKAIKTKYSTEKFGKVSEIGLVEIMDIC